ncbi:porin [Paraburkholderia sp. J12]|uniref:porin n=1 Tax=Paraburkholderia sp. J12 TaxID=2805432 RepID=UPI002ABE9DF1|nr:porin [Paraburkholderia sp. J12]
MKLRWSVMAVLGSLASVAQAQSSVTLYGAIDGGVLYQNTSAATLSPTAKNTGSVFEYKDGGIFASLWGIRGTEDLGGGYRVNFELQGVFNSGTGKLGLGDTAGVGTLFNQQASVGISGPFGRFDAGRQYAPIIYAMADTDVRAAQYFGSILSAWLGVNQAAGWPGTSSNAPLGAVYDSNALVYQSPKFYGASVSLEYAPGGVAGQIQGGTRESAVLKYSNYGLNFAAVYYNAHDTNPTATSVATGLDNNRYYYLGAQYTFRGLSVSGSYSLARDPSDTSRVNYEILSAGFGYRFNPFFKITSGYYYLKDRNIAENHSGLFAVGAEYNLSKRTLLYAQLGYVDNKGTMNQGIVFGTPVAPGAATTAAMIGMRQNF